MMKTQIPEPAMHEVWISTDSCNEYWGWEDIEDLDSRTKIPTDPSAHRYIYTESQLRAAMVAAWNEAIEMAAKRTQELTGWIGVCDAANEIRKLKETP